MENMAAAAAAAAAAAVPAGSAAVSGISNLSDLSGTSLGIPRRYGYGMYEEVHYNDPAAVAAGSARGASLGIHDGGSGPARRGPLTAAVAAPAPSAGGRDGGSGPARRGCESCIKLSTDLYDIAEENARKPEVRTCIAPFFFR